MMGTHMPGAAYIDTYSMCAFVGVCVQKNEHAIS